MDDDIPLPFDLPAVARKKVSAAFDGGRITSDGGVMLLAQAERRLGIADQLARVIPDERDADRVVHLLPDILRARIFAIACGYEDADDLDRLRSDPALKLACGRLPDTDRDLCSQPTVSRWENAPNLRDLIRLMGVMIDLYCASYAKPPDAVTLDIDDTVDVVHGHQQLSQFNAHYDERCFLPIHVYDTATSRPVAVLLRPGKTPSGVEVRGHLRRLVRRIRRHWPQTKITIRGDGHYGRPEVMEWCDEHRVEFIFGLPGNAVLDRAVDEIADDIRTRRALDQKPCLRGFAETSYRAKSWKTDRRACARIEATTKGLEHPLRRHQHRHWIGRAYLRDALLCPGPGRKPDQIAQGAARFGPHQLPQPARQPDAPDPTHRRLLADAHRPRRHPPRHTRSPPPSSPPSACGS
jgi:DDE family transposase